MLLHFKRSSRLESYVYVNSDSAEIFPPLPLLCAYEFSPAPRASL